MTPADLINDCHTAILNGTGLTLVIPGKAHGERKRLCGHRGPLGELLCENREGNCVVRFDPRQVLSFIEKNRGDE